MPADVLVLEVEDRDAVELVVGELPPVSFDVGEYVPMVTILPPEWEGPYEVTPTAEAQTLDTTGHLMTQSLTVAPIPSNWGLITWNGSVITVS